MMMRLELTADYGILHTLAGDAVAVLNKKSFQALYSVGGADHDQFQIHAWVVQTEWDTKVAILRERSVNARKSVKFKVDLLLYGPADTQSQSHVADSLGICQAYLQDPHPSLLQRSYSNPQSLTIPGVHVGTQEMGQALLGLHGADERVETDEEVAEIVQSDPSQLSALIANIDSFLTDLPKHQTGDLVFKDGRIISQLYRYHSPRLVVH